MSLPNENSIYCCKCDCYNIGMRHCYCEDCFTELMTNAGFMIETILGYLSEPSDVSEATKHLEILNKMLFKEIKR